MIFKSGAATLGLNSDRFEIEPETSYTLVLEQKQEKIHIGFGMGGYAIIRWFEEPKGPPRALILEKFDGSFDWRLISQSFVSPSDARYVQVSLLKTGLPGEVSYRNVRLVKGTLRKKKEEMRSRDFEADHQAFRFFERRTAVFLADKNGFSTPEFEAQRAAILKDAAVAAEEILADGKELGKVADAKERQEVIWTEMLKGSQGYVVRPDSPYFERWKAVEERFNRWRLDQLAWLRREMPLRLKREMQEHFKREAGYALGVDLPTLKVGRGEPYTGNVRPKASLSLARQEEESLQLTLAALERDFGKVSVEVSELVDADGRKLPSPVVRRVDQVQTRKPQYYTERVGWWPDILYPSPEAEKVPKGENRSFWVTVVTDSESHPGEYRGEITLRHEGEVLEKLPLEVRVWPIALPKPGKFTVVGRFAPDQLAKFYEWDKVQPEALARWNRYIFNKRWNSTDPFLTTLSPNGEGLKAAVESGINAINLLNVSQLLKQDRPSRTYEWPDAAVEARIKEAVRASLTTFEEIAGEKKEQTQLYLFGFDEQHDPAQFKLMGHVFDLAREVAPTARTITTTTYEPLDELVGKVDTWVPLLGSETPGFTARKGLKTNETFFFYIYGHPFLPFPNASQIDQAGIDSRITFWLAMREGYVGFLHWLMNDWRAQFAEAGRWPQKEWNPLSLSRNGEGNFLYPGPGGEPVSSIRFELIREGIEDWELLNLLKEKLAEGKASPAALEAGRKAWEEAMALTPTAASCQLDDRALMSAREAVAEALIALE